MAIEIISIEPPRSRPVATIITLVRNCLRRVFTRKRKRVLLLAFLALTIAFAAIVSILSSSYVSYSKIVDARLANGYLTSRAGIYAAPRTLRVGQSLSRDALVALLRRAGYVESNATDVWSGGFVTQDASVEIRPRQLTSAASHLVRVEFNENNCIAQLIGDGATLESFTLEPEVLTNDVSMKTGTRATLSFREIPPTLVHAILSIEDHRFFEHNGLDFFGIGRAILRNIGDDQIGQGGSTITQQLVKNTYLSPERTFQRKYAEAMLAFTLERRLSKEDIFALYCNEIYLGQRSGIGVRGVKQAAAIYFGKELKELTIAESALIAGMIQGPNRYSPDRHLEAARMRRNLVIGAMLRDGQISSDQATAGINEPLSLTQVNAGGNAIAPYFVDYVNRIVEAKLSSSNLVDERDARIYTTIDLELQEIAEAAIKHQLEIVDKTYHDAKAKPQAALVALDPQTGNILAMVGGRDYQSTQLNRATDAMRQPGSTFKPFVYAAALETGLSPVSMYADAPHEFLYDVRSKYRPVNYGGGFSMRDVTMRTALVKSLNVVTVDIAMRTGLKRVARYAQDFGLPRPAPYPSLALGTTEATPLAVASAYTPFANAGLRVEPNAIASMTDASGASLIGEAPQSRQVIDPTTAYMITDMLSDVIDHGTARAARGSVKKTAIAGKTGTSRDGWFVGYTPHMVIAVWIGFDDNAQLGMTGAKAALPAWTEFVKNAVELRPELGGEGFETPDGIINIEIDPSTGGIASLACPNREAIAITPALSPNVECFLHSRSYADFAFTAGSSDTGQQSEPNNIQASLNQPPRLRAKGNGNTSQLAASTSTRTSTDSRGRSVLINEMRDSFQRQ